MAERPKAAVLKTVGHASAPWVRILLPPPLFPNDFKHNALRICVLFVSYFR